MGGRVPGWAGFVAAPVVVFLTICSYYAYTRYYRTVSGNAASSPVNSAALQQSTDPQALLSAADHFYWLNNGPAAAPLYARAEKLFSERGDARNELHAKVGRLRSEAETMSFVDLSRFLNEQLQNPIVQAKAWATLDWLSGGRAVAAVGVGWLEEEYKILGVPFHERGRLCDEYLAAMIELWTSESPEFDGKYVSFKDVGFAPKPLQKPHLPIWCGGDADNGIYSTLPGGTLVRSAGVIVK